MCRLAISTSATDMARAGRGDDQGVAIVITMIATLIVSAIAAALVLATSTESLIAGNFRAALEVQYAADSAAELAIADLVPLADWNPLIAGSIAPMFADGPPSGVRTLADATTIDLSDVVSLANCAKLTPCSAADLQRVTAERPWGVNNPVWRLWSYGPLAASSRAYVVVLVADDPAETDGDPFTDGRVEDDNPGAGVLLVRAEAFGLRGARKGVGLTLARVTLESGAVQTRVMSWHRLP